MRMFNPLTPEKALTLTLKSLRLQPQTEEIKITEAYGRVLSENLRSPIDVPERHLAFFDGYAVKTSDLKEASKKKPVKLRVSGKIGLQTACVPRLKSGETFEVCTGAPMPLGADAVIPLEKVMREGEHVLVGQPVEPWSYVIRKGKDFIRGTLLLKAGCRLRSHHLSLLYKLRIKKVKVYRKPKVALLSVGSELTDIFQEDEPEKYPASHSILLEKLVEEAGGQPENLGVFLDDVEALKRALEEALKAYDIVVTMGGSSVGERDLVAEAVELLGEPGIIVNGLKVRPGAATRLGVINGKPIVLIPGLIQSAIIGFHFLLRPIILYLTGLNPHRDKPAVKAKLRRRLPARLEGGFKRVHFVRLIEGGKGFEAEPLTGESFLFSPTVKASGYIVPEGNRAYLPAGSLVNVYLLPGLYALGETA